MTLTSSLHRVKCILTLHRKTHQGGVVYPIFSLEKWIPNLTGHHNHLNLLKIWIPEPYPKPTESGCLTVRNFGRAHFRWQPNSCLKESALLSPVPSVQAVIKKKKLLEYNWFKMLLKCYLKCYLNVIWNDRTQVSCITGGFFSSWTTREAQLLQVYNKLNKLYLQASQVALW